MSETQDRLYKAEDGAALRFFWDTDKNNFQSEAQNRPVYDNVLYVEIFSPGSRESSPVHTVLRKFDKDLDLPDQENPEMFGRYGPQIRAFLENDQSADFTGTPLEQAPFLDRNIIASLREGKIFTVEGLAALPDEKLRLLGLGGRTLRDKAVAYIEAAKGGEATAKLTQEVAELRNEVDVATKRAEAAEARIAQLEKEKNEPTQTEVKKGKGPVQTDKTDGSDII